MKIAAIANAGASHQMAMCAIGRELGKRGHEFLLVGTAFQEEQLKARDVHFQVVGAGRDDPARRYYERAAAAGELPFSATLDYMKNAAALWCEVVPEALRRDAVDVVLADQEEPGAATAAELTGLPYISICNSLPLNADPDVPPGFLAWRYSSGFLARLRNRFGYSLRDITVREIHAVINRYRRRGGLRPYRRPDDSFSTLAQITQLVKEFDFPRRASLRYVGPFQRQALSEVEFPYDRLNGRPLVYASFGTTFGGRTAELRAVAEACATLPVQLVISLGGAEYTEFPGDTIAVRYAPQQELLSRAALAITHGGLNTTMEALGKGVPLLVMPIAGDQFGVASRVEYHGVGMVAGRKRRAPEQLRAAVSSLLEDTRWSAAAKRMQASISNSGGAVEAAQIVESLTVARHGAVSG